MKKVLYITGTGRSGSTLLDLMLGNDERGFSVGELSALMRPWRSHHLINKSKCKCSVSGCDFWYRLKKGGAKNIYQNIFDKLDIDFIVDSSKDPLWLKDQIAYSEKKKYQLIPIIIYKEPLEILYSRYKRDNVKGWKEGWIKTHKRLFEILGETIITIKYRGLAKNPVEKLTALCETIGIDYFDGKEKFWQNQHKHFLFGSGTVRNSDRLVYYEEQFDKSVLEHLKRSFNYEDEKTKKVLSILDAYEVSNNANVSRAIKQGRRDLSDYNWKVKAYHRIKSTPFYFLNSMLSNVID
jgi:hypothetical protein